MDRLYKYIVTFDNEELEAFISEDGKNICIPNGSLTDNISLEYFEKLSASQYDENGFRKPKNEYAKNIKYFKMHNNSKGKIVSYGMLCNCITTISDNENSIIIHYDFITTTINEDI